MKCHFTYGNTLLTTWKAKNYVPVNKKIISKCYYHVLSKQRYTIVTSAISTRDYLCYCCFNSNNCTPFTADIATCSCRWPFQIPKLVRLLKVVSDWSVIIEWNTCGNLLLKPPISNTIPLVERYFNKCCNILVIIIFVSLFYQGKSQNT